MHFTFMVKSAHAGPPTPELLKVLGAEGVFNA
jgi:hypothetical protein